MAAPGDDPTTPAERRAEAEAIVGGNLYMVLGTADGAGVPWVSPVYFAAPHLGEYLWVSKPGARHSRNLAGREQVSIVVFDSSVAIGRGRAVYLAATARELNAADDDLASAVEVFSQRASGHGGVAWSVDDVRAPARHRLYRAVATELFVLDDHDERIPVPLPRSGPPVDR